MAATVLSSQLQALAVASGRPSTKAHTKPSLLFTPAQAADVDLQTILTLSLTGLEGLINMDGRFEAFKKTLFSVESLNLDRELQSRELNEKLNSSIATFLRLLSSYIMLTPAHQVLEYLIRRYKIQIYNVDDLLISIFPYHETSLFVRIVQLLQLKKTKWQFLEGVQKTGAAPPRAALVHRCMTDMAILDALCEAAIKAARMTSKTRTIVSFSAVVVMEILAAVPTVTTSIVNKILPFILHGFEAGIAEEYRVGALMVIGTLANRTPLAQSLLETLIDSMARTIQMESELEGATLLQLSLMVMIQLMQTQDIDKFPAKAFKFLVKVRNLYDLLAKLVMEYDASKFLSLFLTALVWHSASHEHYEQAMLSVINRVPIKYNIGLLVTSLLDLYMGNGGVKVAEQDTSNAKDLAKRLLKAVEMRYPMQLDNAVAFCLQQAGGDGKVAKGSPQQEALREIFSGSLHVPLTDSNSTLYISLDHPKAQIREAAVRQLSELDETSKSGNSLDMKGVLCETLLRCAYDDDFGVVRAVLSVKSLVQVSPPERLFKVLASIISRCCDSIRSGSKVQQGDAKGTASLALKILGSRFLELHPSFLEKVALVIFGHLLVSQKTLKLNVAALKQAAEIPFALFEGLPHLEDAITRLKEASTSKKEELRFVLHDKVVSTLATPLLKNSESLLPVLFKAAAENERAKNLVLFVILWLFDHAPKEINSKLMKPCLLWLRDEWTVLESGKALVLPDPKQIDYQAPGITLESYQLVDTPILSAQLVLKALYKLLELVPVDVKGEAEILNEFYVLFAGGLQRETFSSHLQLLLKRLSAGVFPFLSRYFTAEGSTSSQLHTRSLDLLASFYGQMATGSDFKELESVTAADFQEALPYLLVALANPLQLWGIDVFIILATVSLQRYLFLKDLNVIVGSAAECVQELYEWFKKWQSLASEEVMETDTKALPVSTFSEMLKALLGAKSACSADEKYVATFLNLLVGERPSSNTEHRLKPSAGKKIMTFLLAHALHLPIKAQGTLLIILRGLGHEAEQVGAFVGTLEKMLQRRRQYHLHTVTLEQSGKLLPAEVDLLEILIEMYTPRAAMVLTSSSSAAYAGRALDLYIEALKIEGGSAPDPAVVRPCVAALGRLTSDFFKDLSLLVQEQVFQAVINLTSSTCAEVHAAGHAVLQNLKVPSRIISLYLQHLCNQDPATTESPAKKKRRGKPQKAVELKPSWSTPQQHLSCTAALLEVLSWLPDMDNRQDLVGPLFELLKCTQSEKWPSPDFDSGILEAKEVAASPISLNYVQQLILIALERLASSQVEEKVMGSFDVYSVVHCVAEASDAATRNQALTLLTAVAKLFPDQVLKHVVDILSVIGTSTMTQNDNYSHEVTQQLLVAVVPCWLNAGKDPTTLLEVIVSALPEVPPHRRMALVTTLLRVSKETDSLHIFLLMLLRGVKGERGGVQAMEEGNNSNRDANVWEVRWEVRLADELCQQYEPDLWLPALVQLLKSADMDLLPLATDFVASQLHTLGIVETQPDHQEAYVALLEQALVQLQSNKTIGNQVTSSYAVKLLNVLTVIMPPITYLEGMASLLQHSDPNIRRKVLRLYTTRMKKQDEAKEQSQKRKKVNTAPTDSSVILNEHELQLQMVLQITKLLSSPTEEDSLLLSIKLAAVEALEVCARRLAGSAFSSSGVLVDCLPAVVAIFSSKKKVLCAAAVRCVTTLLCTLGPRALPFLSTIISQLLSTAQHDLPRSQQIGETTCPDTTERPELLLEILKAVEAIVNNLGAFLSPYLGDIIALVVLDPAILTASDVNISGRTTALRFLIPDKIPARLLLDPLVHSYSRALETGESAVCALFQMLGALATKLDRTSVLLCHSRIFNLCLQALDLRRTRPKNLTGISSVESLVVSALVSLILKLSENSFKPLFVSLLEWAQTNAVNEGGPITNHTDRNIAFYKLVNQLTEKLRSLFVPYFGYLLDGCVYNLTGGQTLVERDMVKPKKKKTRLNKGALTERLTLAEWHLRQLVLSSLHKCYLYDTVSFLDAPKFQKLLGPIVSQLLVAPPVGMSDEGNQEDSASVQEMDDALVCCLGQMALTAGSDLLWKPLNHEVLMCSRSESMRARLLALRVVKLLAEQLKEEYLVLLPETLPFLAELLEDSDLNVVAKTQEVVKLLEDLSGESLSQYF